VAKADLGTKRLCASCGAKFYDLSKEPIVCPKCGTVFVVAPVTSRGRPDAAAAAAAAAAASAAASRAAAAVSDDAPEPADAELVSLEDVEAEEEGKKLPGTDAGDDEIEIDQSLDDAAFIAEEEEDSEDVTGIIGDVENEEET